jgi:glycosyltransferase involved in cell wall biosynthesis
VLFVASIEVPSEGGLSSNIENRRMILQSLGVYCSVVSLSTIPRVIRLLLLDLPCFVLARFLGLGAAMYRHMILKRLLAIVANRHLNSTSNMVVFAHDVVAFDAIQKQCNILGHRLILFVHDYYTSTIAGHTNIDILSPELTYLQERECKTYNTASTIFGVDSRIARYIRRMQKNTRQEPYVLLNAPNMNIFGQIGNNRSYRKKFGIEDDVFVILAPRRLYPKNGIRYAIEALADPILSETHVKLVIVGSGSQFEVLVELADNLGVSSQTLFVGSKSHTRMPVFYSIADAVVIPSVTHLGVQEASSISALEAMASSKPVIASRIGGLVEIIDDEVNGILVQERSPEELAKAIIKLRNSPKLVQGLVQNGKDSVVKRVNEFTEILLSIVKGRYPP